jgi:predicted extracellular nuclease
MALILALMKDRKAKKVIEMKRVLSIAIFTLILTLAGKSQPTSFKVMFYNTENLFDTVDDSLKNDEEFLPDGTRHWTKSRYNKKIDDIARVIIAAGEWNAPAIVGLCEVENDKVIGDLLNSELLTGVDYSFVHFDSPDKRGIDICLLYRRDIVRVLAAESWLPAAEENAVFESRNALFVRTEISDDTIDFVVCHWPSRRGGLLASDDQRSMITGAVMQRIDSLHKHIGAGEKIVMMGDFNCGPDFEAIKEIEKRCGLMNLSAGFADRGKGSYRYRGKWEMIDQMLVSDNMINVTPKEHFSYNASFSVFEKEFLLEDDPDYPGKRPFSTYREYRWEGGYSDHLPVLLVLSRSHH